MLSMSFTQVIKLLDQSRFILQRQDQNLLVFNHSCTAKENDSEIEYWKCAVRFCTVRICSRGTSFQLLSEFENHLHNSNSASSTIAFLRENQYLVEKILYPSRMRSRTVSTPHHSTSLPLSIEDGTDDNGAVLKQLLTGKEDVRRVYSKMTMSTTSPLISRTPSSAQQSVIQLPSGLNKHKQAPDFRRLAESHIHVARPTTLMWVRDADCWSPPILTPPPDGRIYSPPSTPVAHIEPYVEPQVMYNPYFLWQLYSYKQSCSNSYNSFSHNY